MSRRFLALATVLVTLNLALWLASSSFGLGSSLRGLPNFLFGSQLMRAEVVMKDGSDYLIDRGRLTTRVTGSSLTLQEADGRVVVVQVSPTAEVRIGALPRPLSALRPGMQVTVVRPGDTPATIVLAQRR